MYYRNAVSIPVAGCWIFYPELMRAINSHNGSEAIISVREDGTVYILSCNIPADWMLDKLNTYIEKFLAGDNNG